MAATALIRAGASTSGAGTTFMVPIYSACMATLVLWVAIPRPASPQRPRLMRQRPRRRRPPSHRLFLRRPNPGLPKRPRPTPQTRQSRTRPSKNLPSPAKRPSMKSAGPVIPSTVCKPGASTPLATGVRRHWATPIVCHTPCRYRSSAITRASARERTGGAVCPIRSTRVSPWPPSAPWPLPLAITATILG